MTGSSFSLALLVLVFSNSGIAEDLKFGCFKNNNFKYELTPGNKVEYGDAVFPLRFEAGPEYERFLSRVEEINDQVSSSFVFSNIDKYIEFYKAYVEYRNSNEKVQFESFYNNYHPEFSPDTDRAGAVISVLDNISEEYSDAMKSSYLVTASGEVEEENLSQSFTHGHVAGVIKISIADEEGFLLLDPAPGAKPITIMANGAQLDKVDYTIGGQEVEYTMLNKDFIAYRIVAENHPFSPPKYTAFYIAKPFCSFLETATKQKLLDSQLFFILHDARGYWKNQIMIKMESNEYAPQLDIMIFDDKEESNMRATELHLDPAIAAEYPVDEAVFNEVCNNLKIAPEKVKGYATELNEIIQDEDFLGGAKSMLAKLKGKIIPIQ